MSLPSGWVSGQETRRVQLAGRSYGIAVHDQGEGPAVVLLHGFPSWSGDWAEVAAGAAKNHRVVAVDFLGFGYSDKPVDHDYSIFEQADVVEQVCAQLRIPEATVVAHDYGTAVAQELLSRSTNGPARLRANAVLFANGAVYPDLHRPTPVQELLLSDAGSEIAAAITREAFVEGVGDTFSDAHRPPGDVVEGMWTALTQQSGNLLAHKLMHYVADRATHGERWVADMEQAQVPLAFVWGLLDPVSGQHVYDRIEQRLPDAHRVALPEVGHWPPIEAPAVVLDALDVLTARLH